MYTILILICIVLAFICLLIIACTSDSTCSSDYSNNSDSSNEKVSSYVYILRNRDSFKDINILKLLRTDDCDIAIKKYNAGVPYPYSIEYILEGKGASAIRIENDLKELLKTYRLEGVNLNKKYYSISSGNLSEIIDNYKGSHYYIESIERVGCDEYKG